MNLRTTKIGLPVPGMRVNLLAGRPKPPVPAFDKTIDLERFPPHYPFVPGGEIQKTAVLYRDALSLSDIPQMEREFRRIKRDDLLILDFVDSVHAAAGPEGEISGDQRTALIGKLKKIGLDFKDPENVRYFASRILFIYGHRYRDERQRAVQVLSHILSAGWQFGGAALARQRVDWLIYHTRPLFVRRDRLLPPLCVFRSGKKIDLPEAFKRNPSRFIEGQENVLAGPSFPDGFAQLAHLPCDVTKVKRFRLGGMPVISKRIDPLRVGSIEEEINAALKIRKILRSRRVAGCRPVEFIGLVYDAGNFYLLMKDEQAPSLFYTKVWRGVSILRQVQRALREDEYEDMDLRNALWNGKQLVLYDFDWHTSVLTAEYISPGSVGIYYARLSRAASPGDLGGEGEEEPVVQRFRSVLGISGRAGKIKSQPSLLAIGDIHGNAGRLRQLLASEPARRAKKIVFLGDYFDHDPGAREVFDILRSRAPEGSVFLRGNHELYFMLAMRGDYASFVKWISEGGLDFLSAVLDLDWFRKEFEEARSRLPESITGDIIGYLEKNRPGQVRELFEHAKNNACLKEVLNWLVENSRLFYLDDYGQLYIHAGIKPGGGLSYLDGLRAAELEFNRLLMSDEPAFLKVAIELAKLFEPCLEMRSEWQKPFTADGCGAAREKLLGMGIRAVIYGHTPGSGVSNKFNRFLGIDLSMAEYYGGGGGMLEVGPEGLAVYSFAGRGSDDLKREVIISGEEFCEDLQRDAPELIKVFQEYFY